MKLKIILMVLIIYMTPGIYFSKDYGYFNTQTWQKINGELYRNRIVDVYSASYNTKSIYICFEREFRGKRSRVGVSLPVDLGSGNQGGFRITDNVSRSVTVPLEGVDPNCLKSLEKQLPIKKIKISESDRSFADMRFDKIENKTTPSIYVYKGDYSSLIINVWESDEKFDDYFVELEMKNLKGSLYWYFVLLFAFVADCLTYPFQYFIYVYVGIE